MKVITYLSDGRQYSFTAGVASVVIVQDDEPLLDRQSHIERVNLILDQYEPKDARPT